MSASPGLRKRLAGVLDRLGAIDAIFEARRRLPSPWLTVVTYHRIQEPSSHSFDRGVIDATPEEFDRQLALYRRYFSVVTMDEVLAFLRGGKLPRNPLLVTFDDGYLDNHDVALPILERHGVRAVFFVATQYLTERRLFWWDRISYVLSESQRDVIEIDYPSRLQLVLSGENGRSDAVRKAQRIVKDTYQLDVDRFLDRLTAAAGVPWSAEIERRLADELVMSWDHIRALRAAGQSVQSHTRSHRVLQTLTPRDLMEELSESRADLERELGEPIRVISYPVGRGIADLPNVREALHATGYEAGFSNVSGVTATWREIDPFDLRRIAVEGELTPSYFRGILAIPGLV